MQLPLLRTVVIFFALLAPKSLYGFLFSASSSSVETFYDSDSQDQLEDAVSFSEEDHQVAMIEESSSSSFSEEMAYSEAPALFQTNQGSLNVRKVISIFMNLLSSVVVIAGFVDIMRKLGEVCPNTNGYAKDCVEPLMDEIKGFAWGATSLNLLNDIQVIANVLIFPSGSRVNRRISMVRWFSSFGILATFTCKLLVMAIMVMNLPENVYGKFPIRVENMNKRFLSGFIVSTIAQFIFFFLSVLVAFIVQH